MLSCVEASFGDDIRGLGVKKVTIAASRLGGVMEYDYIELMGKSAKLADILDSLRAMRFHSARVALDNDWVLCVDADMGIRGLEKS